MIRVFFFFSIFCVFCSVSPLIVRPVALGRSGGGRGCACIAAPWAVCRSGVFGIACAVRHFSKSDG